MAAKKKGFGSDSQPKQAAKGKKSAAKPKGRARKSKGKSLFRPEHGQQAPAQNGTPAMGDTRPEPSATQFQTQAEQQPKVEDDAGFEDRLAQLASASKLLEKEKRIEKAQNEGALTSTDAYSNPPSILDSMKRNKDDDPDRVDPTSNVTIAGIAGAALLATVLILGAIGLDRGDSDSSTPQISADDKAQLQAQLDRFKSSLQADANDAEALEGAAVTYANLGELKQAEESLSRLVTLEGKTTDVDAWRLLAETRSALKMSRKAADAYQQAYNLAGNDLEVVKGYTSALIADGRPDQAVTEVQGLRERVQSGSAAGASSTGRQGMTPVEVNLLLAKVYTQWRGHTTEALATYDKVVAEHPDDYRGHLAKGVLLRSEGRNGDADRAFLQARYLAPKEVRAIVDRVASQPK